MYQEGVRALSAEWLEGLHQTTSGEVPGCSSGLSNVLRAHWAFPLPLPCCGAGSSVVAGQEPAFELAATTF